MLICAEQVQIQKYKTHAYKTLKTAGVQIIMLKHLTKHDVMCPQVVSAPWEVLEAEEGDPRAAGTEDRHGSGQVSGSQWSMLASELIAILTLPVPVILDPPCRFPPFFSLFANLGVVGCLLNIPG